MLSTTHRSVSFEFDDDAWDIDLNALAAQYADSVLWRKAPQPGQGDLFDLQPPLLHRENPLFCPFQGMGIFRQPRHAQAGKNPESAQNSINQFAENLNCHGTCREEPSVVWCDGQGRYIAATTRSPMAVQETFFIPVSKISAVR